MPVQKGFSLIELVTVMVLLGILTAVIAPRFSSRDGFAEHAVRDQLISAFRFAQQRAMYDHSGNCYRLNIDAGGFGPENGTTSFGPAGRISFAGDYSGLSVSPAAPVYFDGLGNAYTTGCSNTLTANPLTVTVNPSGIQFEVYSSGYIRAI